MHPRTPTHPLRRSERHQSEASPRQPGPPWLCVGAQLCQQANGGNDKLQSLAAGTLRRVSSCKRVTAASLFSLVRLNKKKNQRVDWLNRNTLRQKCVKDACRGAELRLPDTLESPCGSEHAAAAASPSSEWAPLQNMLSQASE